METDAARPRELPIVGGHLGLDFANTIDDPNGPQRYDHAATYEGLVGWAGRVEIVSAAQASSLLRRARRSPAQADAALASAHRLRRVVGSMFSDIAAGVPARPRQWSVLRRYVATAYAAAELDWTDGRARPRWRGTDRLDVLLDPIAVAALELLESPELARVKRCAACRWLFVDRSKNASRRWCAMNDCGTNEKMRRYVARRAERRRPAQ